jgi:hypothetical protein
MLLPRQKRERLAGEATLRVDQKLLEEPDRVRGLFFVEVKLLAFFNRLVA